jgi:tetratricopeptide (TPR) repeat protein
MLVKEQQNQATSIIAINNDAVYYFKIGELNESYSLLSEAIATLQNMIREQPPPNGTPVLRYSFRWNDLTYSNANYVFESSDQRSELPFLFQRCLTVDMPRKREIRAKKLCLLGLCPILHYNLALVAHILGIQKAEDGRSYLQEAYRLYGMVSADLRSRRCSAGSATAVLLMGIWNNQGCICIELGVEEHEATQILGLLRKLLMRKRESSNQLPGWRYLYLNLVIMEKQRSVAAAA